MPTPSTIPEKNLQQGAFSVLGVLLMILHIHETVLYVLKIGQCSKASYNSTA